MKIKRKLFRLLEPFYIRPGFFNRQMFLTFLASPSREIVLFKLTIQICLTLLLSPVALLLRLSGIVILPVNINQIGNVIWLDCFLRETIQKNKKYTLIIVPASKELIANQCLINLYRKHVYIAESLFEYGLLFPFVLNPICTDFLIRFDAGGDSLSVHKTLGSTDNEMSPLISLPHQTRKNAQLRLKEIGLSPNEKFVALHVRDSFYYGDTKTVSRNASLDTYVEAINYLSSKGYKIVLLGHPNSTSCNHLLEQLDNNFIDYAHSGINSDEIDCYLMSDCEFLVGTDSGPAFVVPLFHKNVLLTNGMPPSRSLFFRQGDLSLFKKIYNKKTGELLSLQRTLSKELFPFNNIRLLEQNGFYIRNNTPDEILEVVIEHIEKIPNNEFTKKINVMIPDGCRNFSAKGKFSRYFIEKNYSQDMN